MSPACDAKFAVGIAMATLVHLLPRGDFPCFLTPYIVQDLRFNRDARILGALRGLFKVVMCHDKLVKCEQTGIG